MGHVVDMADLECFRLLRHSVTAKTMLADYNHDSSIHTCFNPYHRGRYQASNHQRVKGLPCYKSVFDSNIDLSNPATHKGNNALEGYNLL